MAEMIGRTKSWLAWLAGAVLALVFGGAGCGREEIPQPVYGAPPTPPTSPAQEPAPQPAEAEPAANLEASPDWKVIVDAWDFIMPFARSGQSTDDQRKEIDAKLAAAREAAGRLAAKAGLLSEKEAELLNSEAERAAKDIRREPPIGVNCYDMAAVPAVQRLSFESIAERLPAIEALVAGGKVHPAAIVKVLEAIEADLVALSDEKRRARLGDSTPQGEAERRRAELTAQVARIKAGLLLQIRPPVRMCYDIQMIPEPKPQSARELEERLAMLDRLERSGRLPAAAADKTRRAIADGRERVRSDGK